MSGFGLSFSHVGLFVHDMDKIVDFYERALGFFVTDHGVLNGNRITFLSRDPREHHQIVFVAGRNVPRESKLLNQLSFRVASLRELLTFARSLNLDEVSDLEPVIHGNAWSLYFRDPEHNRLEVFADSDWYINQPIKEVLDFSLSEEEIRALTYEYCRQQPGFKPIAEWQAEMGELMGATVETSS